MITIKDMAEMLGISTTTVSNVIHGKTSEVSQKTVERVEKLLDKYEYVPNISARSLSQNSSKIIGVALKCRKDKYANLFSDPFFGELIGALEAEIRAQGYFMMIYTSNDISEIIRNVLTWNVDGLILVGMLHDDFIRIKSRYKNPTVLIDSYASREIMNYVNIGLEDEEGAYEITRYLLKMGHRRIAFLADNYGRRGLYALSGTFEGSGGLWAGDEGRESSDLPSGDGGTGIQFEGTLLPGEKLYGVYVLFGLLCRAADELFYGSGDTDSGGSLDHRV